MSGLKNGPIAAMVSEAEISRLGLGRLRCMFLAIGITIEFKVLNTTEIQEIDLKDGDMVRFDVRN